MIQQQPPPATRSVRMVSAALVATTSSALPVFLVGGLAVQMSEDLGFGTARLGALATIYFASSAVSSIPAGRLVERVGTYRGLLLSAALSCASLLGAATIGRTWALLAAFLVLGGVANSVGQPAANLLIARGVRPQRQGLAFGIKQGAIPVASFLAGAAVPLLALTVGWRWAFAAGVIGPVALVYLAPRTGMTPPRRTSRRLREGDSPVAGLVVIATAACFSVAAANALGTFLVSAMVARGVSPSTAGIMLATGSAAGIAGRVYSGWRADRGSGRPLRTVGWMLAAGAVGFAMLASLEAVPSLILATLVAFGAGWGWGSLLVYAVVRANRNAPAAATGITQTGLYLGGVLGPMLFGLVSEQWSFEAGWWMCAAFQIVGAVMILVGERLMVATASAPVED